MKRSLSFIAAGIALLAFQACAPKTEKSIVENESVDITAETPATLTPEEKRARADSQRVAQAERRRLAYEERLANTPYYTDENGNVVYNRVDVNPSFVGGKDAMTKYLRDNLEFPKEAVDEGLEATLFVDFIVMANGTVREVMVTDEPGEVADQRFKNEAIRVVTAMPKWTPGRQNGKPVDVKYNLPITFQMQ